MLKTFLKKLFGHFFMDGVQLPQGSSLEPLQGQKTKFTFYTKFPEIPGTHFIDLRRMKGCVDLRGTQWF